MHLAENNVATVLHDHHLPLLRSLLLELPDFSTCRLQDGWDPQSWLPQPSFADCWRAFQGIIADATDKKSLAFLHIPKQQLSALKQMAVGRCLGRMLPALEAKLPNCRCPHYLLGGQGLLVVCWCTNNRVCMCHLSHDAEGAAGFPISTGDAVQAAATIIQLAAQDEPLLLTAPRAVGVMAQLKAPDRFFGNSAATFYASVLPSTQQLDASITTAFRQLAKAIRRGTLALRDPVGQTRMPHVLA